MQNFLYSGGQMLAVVLSSLFGIFWAKKYGIGKLKAFLIVVFSQVIAYPAVFLLTWIENGFQRFGEQNAIRFYVFSALVGLIECKLFKIDFKKCIDFQAVIPPLCYGLGHFACLAKMCCFGYHYTEGSLAYKVAHALTGTDQLPMQVLESVSALLVFLIVVIIAFKTHFKVTGKLLGIYQILFCMSRFLWEFLRDNKKIIIFAPMNNAAGVESHGAVWGISSLALWAFAVALAGVILLIVLKIKEKNKGDKELAEA